MGKILGNYLVEAALFGGGMILLMIAARRFLRNKVGNRAIWAAWLLVAIRLLVPIALPNPAINELRPADSAHASAQPVAEQVRLYLKGAVNSYNASVRDAGETVDGDAAAESQGPANGADAATAYISYDQIEGWAVYAYFAGAACALLWMLARNMAFGREMRKKRVALLSGEVQDIYHEICLEQGVKPLPVYVADPLQSACIVGAIRPYIALPLTMTREEARLALLHELGHYRGHDTWWAMLRNVCCVVQWFNPLVWLGARLSRQDCELACDDRVTQHMSAEQRREYASVLLSLTAKRSTPGVAVVATGMTSTGKKLKQRMAAILESRRVRRRTLAAFALVGCAVLVLAFGTRETERADLADAASPMQAVSTAEAAVQLAWEYLQNPPLAAEGSYVGTPEDWCAVKLSDQWHVSLASFTGEKLYWLIEAETGRLLRFWRGFLMEEEEITYINADMEDMTRLMALAVRTFLGDGQVSDVRIMGQYWMEGQEYAKVTAALGAGGETGAMTVKLSSGALKEFSLTELGALQDQLLLWPLMEEALQEEMGIGRGQVGNVLHRIYWDEDRQRFIGLISSSLTWMSQEAVQRLEERYGRQERCTLRLVVDPYGEGIEAMEWVEPESYEEITQGLYAGVTSAILTAYEVIDGRYLNQVGGIPAGTAYEALDRMSLSESGIIDVDSVAGIENLTLIRYVHPIYGVERAQWVVTESLMKQTDEGGQEISVEWDGEEYGVRMIPGGTMDIQQPEGALPLEDAVVIALEAVMEQYGLSIREVTTYPVEYEYNAESTPVWRIDIPDLYEPSFSYEVYVASPSGDVVKIYGPQDGNG